MFLSNFVENVLVMLLDMSRKLSTVRNQLKLFSNHTLIYFAEWYKYIGTIINLSPNKGLQLEKV